MKHSIYTKEQAKEIAEDLKNIFRDSIQTRPDTLEAQCRNLYEQLLDRDDTIVELRQENEHLTRINRRLRFQIGAVRELTSIGD